MYIIKYNTNSRTYLYDGKFLYRNAYVKRKYGFLGFIQEYSKCRTPVLKFIAQILQVIESGTTYRLARYTSSF
jgi:hypothetical protein